jgi:hypothetical protein
MKGSTHSFLLKTHTLLLLISTHKESAMRLQEDLVL